MPYDQVGGPDYSVGIGTGAVGRMSRGEPQSVVDRDVLAGLPYETLAQYNELAKSGFLGQGGGARLSAQAWRAGAGRRKAQSRGLRKRLRGRLGSRSLAAETTIANTITAPTLAAADERTAGYELQNQMSKLQGLEGTQNLMRFLQGRFERNREFDAANDVGFSDYAIPLIELVSRAAAAYASGGTSEAAQAVPR